MAGQATATRLNAAALPSERLDDLAKRWGCDVRELGEYIRTGLLTCHVLLHQHALEVSERRWDGLYPHRDGSLRRRPLHHSFLHKGLRAALDRCPGLPRVDLHGLRHSFASIAIGPLRLPPTQVAKLLGHKDASITLDTYAHWFEGLSSEGAMGDLAAAICTPRGDQMVTSSGAGSVAS